MSTLLIIVLAFVLLGGGLGWSYGDGAYRGYVGPGLGTVLVVLLILYLAGMLR